MSVMRSSILIVVVILTGRALASDQISPEQINFFEAKIRPVLVKECYGCHSSQAGDVRGGLRLDTQALTHIGGSTGPAVVPGNLEESLLYNAITHQDFDMPPKRKLAQAVIDDFRTWIEMGAPDPRITEIAEIKSSISAADIARARETFWAYQQPIKQASPVVQNSSWPETEIDRFILDRLEAANLNPAADAAANTLVRRLCFDLVGLPPSPSQIEEFTEQWSVDPTAAITALVNRLLDTEQYGERWGRHWLDVARYAESTGREVNVTYPHAWRYRDYVIDSFNADKPFNEFVQEQIAGDLLPTDSDDDWIENLIATTFLALGPKNVNEQNRVQFAADLVDEQIDATTRVFLGMSVSCARCHDHKFDAIPQSDYYALQGVFSNLTTYFGNPPSEFGAFSPVQQNQNSSLIRLPVSDPNPYDKSYSEQELTELKAEITDTLQEIAELRRNQTTSPNGPNSQRMRLALNNKLADLSDKLAVVDASGAPISYCMGVQEKGPPRDRPLLVRGEIDQASQIVPRGLPQVLCEQPLAIQPTESGRLAMARWLGSDANSLTARVMVNRVWQHLLGQGIVRSTENFGVTGQAPSHPELLDYLAVRFVETGWSVKSLIRDITTSRVYRMTSTFDQVAHETDPDNALLWRANPKRLDAEAIRDAMLAISGEIDLARPRGSEVARAGYTRVRDGVLGDPRETIRKTMLEANQRRAAEFSQSRGRPGGIFGGGRFLGPNSASSPSQENSYAEALRNVTHQLDMEDAKFRSVYLPIVRDAVPRALDVFDFADADSITGTREESHTANQALFMMNNRFVIRQSDAFAHGLQAANSQLTDQIDNAFMLAFARSPSAAERRTTADFVRSFAPTTKLRSRNAAVDEALSAFCQSLFAAAEFRILD